MNGPAATAQSGVHDRRWPTTVASLVVGASFLALWFWLLPSWLDFHLAAASISPWRWCAALPSALGFAVALRCIWDFGWAGRGTPAPIAPPRRLVVVGFYRYVRNPMYLGFFLGWASLSAIFGRITPITIIVAVGVVICVALFVVQCEEPALRRLFGKDYEDYCANVHRWIPHLHPWKSPASRRRN
jgi:protein-S-isoprenylcysteine O-methyltransferase Ste14